MAVVDRTSAAITNATATPIVFNNPEQGATRRIQVNTVVTPAADDSANSIGRFCRVPSNATNIRLEISAADATTAGAINLGVYQTSGNGGAVVDADLFASAFDLTGGPFDHAQVTFESGEYTYAESITPLWEALGLSEDPHREYDIAYTISTTFNGGPTAIKLAVSYQV